MQESVTLFYREGSSDKTYQLQLVEQSGQWVVNFQYGRRGSSLKAGTKTQTPVDYAKAKKIYDKIKNEKTTEGYTEGADGVAYAGTEKAGQVSGILPQLLNYVEEEDVELLLNNNTHCAQEKKDGKRTMVQAGDEIDGINKKGLLIPLSEPIRDAYANLGLKLTTDGEAIGDIHYIFDLLQLNGKDLRSWSYKKRYEALSEVMAGNKSKVLQLVPTAWTPKDKRKLLEKLKKENAEGIVFKEVDAAHKHGKPPTGGSQLKYKFYKTAHVSVLRVNSQRSVGVAVFPNTKDLTRPIDVGNVTIPPNKNIPQVGQIIEVRYLYAYEGGCLFQPTYLEPRTDVEPEECLIRQLKYKQANDEDES